MEAIDTVMSKEKRRYINDTMPSDARYGDVFLAIAEAQAELTWDKAKEYFLAQGREQTLRELLRGLNDNKD